MDDTQESADGKIVDLKSRIRRRNEDFLSQVDELTKQLYFAIRPIRTAIALTRRDCNLPPLE